MKAYKYTNSPLLGLRKKNIVAWTCTCEKRWRYNHSSKEEYKERSMQWGCDWKNGQKDTHMGCSLSLCLCDTAPYLFPSFPYRLSPFFYSRKRCCVDEVHQRPLDLLPRKQCRDGLTVGMDNKTIFTGKQAPPYPSPTKSQKNIVAKSWDVLRALGCLRSIKGTGRERTQPMREKERAFRRAFLLLRCASSFWDCSLTERVNVTNSSTLWSLFLLFVGSAHFTLLGLGPPFFPFSSQCILLSDVVIYHKRLCCVICQYWSY